MELEPTKIVGTWLLSATLKGSTTFHSDGTCSCVVHTEGGFWSQSVTVNMSGLWRIAGSHLITKVTACNLDNFRSLHVEISEEILDFDGRTLTTRGPEGKKYSYTRIP